MATPSSTLAWRIPWTEEPGGLRSMGRQESDTAETLSTHTHTEHLVRAESGYPFLPSLPAPREQTEGPGKSPREHLFLSLHPQVFMKHLLCARDQAGWQTQGSRVPLGGNFELS